MILPKWPQDASEADIKRAYKKLALKWGPEEQMAVVLASGQVDPGRIPVGPSSRRMPKLIQPLPWSSAPGFSLHGSPRSGLFLAVGSCHEPPPTIVIVRWHPDKNPDQMEVAQRSLGRIEDSS